MGFESFRVDLREGTVSYAEAEEMIRQHPHVRPDRDAVPLQGSTCYVMDDGAHAIELELMDAPVHMSCRFTLCHPPSVDAAFLDLVRQLMDRLGLKANICDVVRDEDA